MFSVQVTRVCFPLGIEYRGLNNCQYFVCFFWGGEGGQGLQLSPNLASLSFLGLLWEFHAGFHTGWAVADYGWLGSPKAKLVGHGFGLRFPKALSLTTPKP